MGKFDTQKDYSFRSSMNRSSDQHNKYGNFISDRKKQIIKSNQNASENPETEKKVTDEFKTAASVPSASAIITDDEIIKELGRLTDVFRATNGEKEEQELRAFANVHHLNLRVEAAVSKTDKSMIARMVFNGGVEKPMSGYSQKFNDLANYPFKYSIRPGKPEDYNLEDSTLWQAMAEEPRLAGMKEKMQKALAQAGVPVELLPEMNLNDFKYLMFNYCAAQKGLGFAKLFQEKDENGKPITYRDFRACKDVPVCTSAKQENVKRFMKENPQFKDMLLKMPEADSKYIEELVKKMQKTGLTDMTKELEKHPEWANQPAIDVHHIVNIKDCRLFESMGKSYADVNAYENMCIVSNGHLKDALDRSNDVEAKGSSIHGAIHSADMTFKDRKEPHGTNRTMVRLEPQSGVQCMLGFSENMMIINHEYQKQYEKQLEASNNRLSMNNYKQNSGEISA